MDEEHDFLSLMRRVRAGDHTAAAELMKRYVPAVRRVIRLKLRDSRMRRVLDSMDICQGVFASFFIRAASGQYDLDRPGQLLRLLVVMARNKLVSESRTYYVARREPPGPAVDAVFAGLATPEPSPSGRLAWKDLLHEVRRRLTEDERRLADWRAERREWSEIAAEVGGNPEALRKRFARALDRVSNQLGLEGLNHG
ncbi:MAG TPA: sigma-70 family RNA polymerase sigma factor [Gemmataceae bacterium]|jgi:RNA polymerase sigma-70 factor (ECF subfamily)|nr:sigma-70 family RNA polymerase sigma factor [Gemmataceae bacterium]